MDTKPETRQMTRREILQLTTVLGGSTWLTHMFPELARATPVGSYQQASAAPTDPVAAVRAQMAMAPMETLRLSDRLAMLSGPGGNVVVLHGPDGKIVVDSFVEPVWGKLKQTIDSM